MRNILPLQKITSLGWPVQTAQDIHKGRLSRSGGTHYRHKFVLLDGDVYPSQSMDLEIAQIIDLNQMICGNQIVQFCPFLVSARHKRIDLLLVI